LNYCIRHHIIKLSGRMMRHHTIKFSGRMMRRMIDGLSGNDPEPYYYALVVWQ
jgi:hypothetical protein